MTYYGSTFKIIPRDHEYHNTQGVHVFVLLTYVHFQGIKFKEATLHLGDITLHLERGCVSGGGGVKSSYSTTQYYHMIARPGW